MIHIVRGMNDPDSARALETMFVDRKRLFVDLLGWDVPIVDGRYEIDRFDGAHARYLIACDERGNHVGSMRLLPTTRPHILDTLFAELSDGAVPRGEDVFEITRLCLPSRLGAAERLRVRNLLISAMVDYATAAGITALTGVVQADFRKQILTMGWACEALGWPRVFGRQLLGAFWLAIGTETADLLKTTGIYVDGSTSPARALRFVPSERSAGDTVRRDGITKAGNGRVRHMLVESAWTYRHPPRVGKVKLYRLEQTTPKVREIAWKAQSRLTARYRSLTAKGKKTTVVCAAIARELAGFMWAVAREVQPA